MNGTGEKDRLIDRTRDKKNVKVIERWADRMTDRHGKIDRTE